MNDVSGERDSFSGATLFQPDVVLPEQYYGTANSRLQNGGERRLMIALLHDAVACFQKNLMARDNRGRRLFREAERWMMSDDKELPFSFQNVCEFLNLDPSYLRRSLRRWAQRTVREAGVN